MARRLKNNGQATAIPMTARIWSGFEFERAHIDCQSTMVEVWTNRFHDALRGEYRKRFLVQGRSYCWSNHQSAGFILNWSAQ